jgi:hypothetical protein
MFFLKGKLKGKSRLFLILFSLATAVVGCGHSDLESQLIEEDAKAKLSFPPEVLSAMEAEIDEVEVPIESSEGGLSKPTEFSKVYIIDYVERSGHAKPTDASLEAPILEKVAPTTDTITCGSSLAYRKKNYKWKSFPILYSISTENLTAGVGLAAAKTAVVNALNAWDNEERPVGNLFLEAKNGETPSLTVRWGKIDGKNKVLGITENSFNVKTKIIISSRITFDSADTWKVFPSFDCKSQGSEFDIESVAAHEVGHVIGLLHPPNNSKNKALTMYAATAPGETLKRTLDKGDKAGVSKLYPAKK